MVCFTINSPSAGIVALSTFFFVSELVLPVFFKRVWPVVRQVVALIHALSFSCTAFHADLFMKDAVDFPELMSCTALSLTSITVSVCLLK